MFQTVPTDPTSNSFTILDAENETLLEERLDIFLDAAAAIAFSALSVLTLWMSRRAFLSEEAEDDAAVCGAEEPFKMDDLLGLPAVADFAFGGG